MWWEQSTNLCACDEEIVIKSQDKLPTLYWLHKMHKDPIGSRFTAAPSTCILLSQLLTVASKLITKHLKHPYKNYKVVTMLSQGSNKVKVIVTTMLQWINNLVMKYTYDGFMSTTFSQPCDVIVVPWNHYVTTLSCAGVIIILYYK